MNSEMVATDSVASIPHSKDFVGKMYTSSSLVVLIFLGNPSVVILLDKGFI